MKRIFSILIGTIMCVAACEPIGPLAGSKLSGREVDIPSSWNDFNTVDVIQLETHDRYAVNLWGVGLDHAYYVVSSRGEASGWAKRVKADKNVRLRIYQSIYPLQAIVVRAVEERDMVAAEFKKKYDLDSSSDFPDAVVYRLDPR